jgi:hypothetical protein
MRRARLAVVAVRGLIGAGCMFIDLLDDAGLGLLADVEEDDGSQVLIWLR